MRQDPFRSDFARRIWAQKYAQGPNDSWPMMAKRLVEDVCGKGYGKHRMQLMSNEEMREIEKFITEMKFIPAGRYLYYAGRDLNFFNNCLTMKCEEDSREEWGRITHRAISALMSGAGIGVDYSPIRPGGYMLSRTGGIASGPIPLMNIINESGRNVVQGGSRRSAIMSILSWLHEDVNQYIHMKDWPQWMVDAKAQDFNFPAPMDMTNISVSWNTDFIEQIMDGGPVPDLWYETVEQMCKTGEPGHLYNFWDKEDETARNACGELTSEDDSDPCNLGAVNFSRIESIQELARVTHLASKFLVCGALRADLPYNKVYEIRETNMRIGLGVMGLHEWLIKRGYRYEPNEELANWLTEWKHCSETGANEHCDRFYLNRPRGYRAIAPTGTIGSVASTTTGIEPIFATAYKRRYLVDGTRWRYEYVIDATAENILQESGVDPRDIETAYTLAEDPERRVAFQAWVQQFVDHAISSTVNLPEWGSEQNNPDKAKEFSGILLQHCKDLRGITVYPEGARGGQPITPVPYDEAKNYVGTVFDEQEDRCWSGHCGL